MENHQYANKCILSLKTAATLDIGSRNYSDVASSILFFLFKQLSKWRSVHFLGLAALFGQVWKLIWTLVWTKQVSSGPPDHLAANQTWLLVHLQINPGATLVQHYQWERVRIRGREGDRDSEPKRRRILQQYCYQPKLLHYHHHHCPLWARTTFLRTCHGCSPHMHPCIFSPQVISM